MSVTVGAALKKIAVALLSDKKTLKKAAMAILVVIVALFMPRWFQMPASSVSPGGSGLPAACTRWRW